MRTTRRVLFQVSLLGFFFCLLTTGWVNGQQPPPPGPPPAQAASKFLTMISHVGGFEIRVPDFMPPVIQTANDGKGKKIQHNLHKIAKGRIIYYIDWADFNETLDSSVLPGAGKAMAAGIEGKLLKTTELSFDGNRGFESRILMKDGETLLIHQGLYVGKRAYQLVVELPKEMAELPEVTGFLSSFKLRKPVSGHSPDAGSPEIEYRNDAGKPVTPPTPKVKAAPQSHR